MDFFTVLKGKMQSCFWPSLWSDKLTQPLSLAVYPSMHHLPCHSHLMACRFTYPSTAVWKASGKQHLLSNTVPWTRILPHKPIQTTELPRVYIVPLTVLPDKWSLVHAPTSIQLSSLLYHQNSNSIHSSIDYQLSGEPFLFPRIANCLETIRTHSWSCADRTSHKQGNWSVSDNLWEWEDRIPMFQDGHCVLPSQIILGRKLKPQCQIDR